MSEFTAELIGTMILLLLGNGVVANVVLKDTKGNNSGWIVIAFGWGFAVFSGVMVAGPISGAHLNPAVTVGLALAGSFAWAKVPAFILAQMIGAAIGTSLVWLTYRQHYDRTDDRDGKLATFCTAPAIRNYPDNLISEVIGTFILVFVVLYMAGPVFTPDQAADAPVGLGAIGALPVAFLVTAIGLSLGGTTGYAINPARDLAPRIMHTLLPIRDKRDSDWSYSWVPVAGPLAGAAIAGLLYLALTPIG